MVLLKLKKKQKKAELEIEATSRCPRLPTARLRVEIWWGGGGVVVVFTTAQVNKPVCVRVGGGRLTEVSRTAVVAVGAISTDKDPQRASQTSNPPQTETFFSLHAEFF